jgi:hypothetical protein
MLEKDIWKFTVSLQFYVKMKGEVMFQTNKAGCLKERKKFLEEIHMDKIKDFVFNKEKYSGTKKAITIFFIVLFWFLNSFTKNKLDDFIIILMMAITGFVYFISKMFLYNKKINIRDILYSIIFLGLFFGIVYKY